MVVVTLSNPLRPYPLIGRDVLFDGGNLMNNTKSIGDVTSPSSSEEKTESISVSNTTLFDALCYGMRERASSRTNRYFVLNKSALFEERLKKVVNTLETIRCTRGVFIQALDGETYGLSEYNVPSALSSYVSFGRVYGCIDCIGRDVSYILNDIGKFRDALPPSAFNRFFDDFNSAQEEEFKIKLVNLQAKKDICLSDVSYAKKGDIMVKLFGDVRSSDIYTPFIVGMPYVFNDDYFTEVPCPTKEGVARWLFDSES